MHDNIQDRLVFDSDSRICGLWLALRIQDEHAGDVGTQERENEIRMVPIFKHTHEVSVPHIHSLRGSLHLALGNRHHLRSGFPSFPLASGNQTDPLPDLHAIGPLLSLTGVAVEKGTKAVISVNFSVYGRRTFNNLRTNFGVEFPGKEFFNSHA